MKNYLAAAADELDRLERDLRRVGLSDHIECLVRLELVGRLLLGDGVIGRATAEVVSASSLDEGVVEMAAVRLGVERVSARARGLLREIERDAAAVVRGRAELQQTVDWCGSTNIRVGSILAELRDRAEAWAALGLEDLRKLYANVFPALAQCFFAALTELESGDASSSSRLSNFRDRLVAVNEGLMRALNEAETAMLFANASNHRNTCAVLRRLVSAADRLRAPGATVDIEAFHSIATQLTELVPRCERLVSAVRARVLEGPDRAFAIERLTLKLQQFESGLLKNMLKAKRPEDILQVAVNNFIFAEGLYPITQFVVGRGRLDTMVEVPAEASGIRCILIELKQAVKNPTRKRLQALVANARAQTEQYSSNLRASARWAAHEVYFIIAYAGPKRFLVDEGDPRVRLVYLGNAPPSARAIPLFDA